jgi:thiamine kinase-like enzyme
VAELANQQYDSLQFPRLAVQAVGGSMDGMANMTESRIFALRHSGPNPLQDRSTSVGTALDTFKQQVNSTLGVLGLEVRGKRLVAVPRNTSPEEVVSGLLGARARINCITQIVEGAGNSGIFVYTATDDSQLPRRSSAQFVAKRTDSWAEREFARKLHRRRTEDNAYSIFPEIYGVGRVGGAVTVYMEYLYGVGTIPPFNRTTAEAIVRALYQLNQCFPKDRPSADATDVVADWHRRLVEHVKQARVGRFDPERAVEPIERILRQLKGWPLVLSHNDLHWSNMAQLGTDRQQRTRLIDLGHLSVNLAGAEFHHFAHRAIFSGAYREFHGHLLAAYGALTGHSEDALWFASHCYALVRSASRIDWESATPDAKEKRKRELQYFSRLYDAVLSRLPAHAL